MAIILDTWDEIFIGTDTAEVTRQLLERLPASPTEEVLTELTTAILGCDTLDVPITRTTSKISDGSIRVFPYPRIQP